MYQPRTFLWAIDPHEEAPLEEINTYHAICAFAQDQWSQIEPVCVITPEPLVALDSNDFHAKRRCRKVAAKALQEKLEKLGVGPIRPPKVLMTEGHTFHDAARTLARYAVSVDAEMIVTHTHGRSGFSRMFSGSFTEALIQLSEVPVLAIGPRAKSVSEVRHILFPTEFDANKFRTFQRVVRMAQMIDSEVLLYHRLSVPIHPVDFTVFTEFSSLWETYRRPSPENSDLLLEYLPEEQKRVASEWCAYGHKEGVRVTLVVEETAKSIADSVTTYAQTHPCELIALESHDVPGLMSNLGKERQAIGRNSPCPVWVNPMH